MREAIGNSFVLNFIITFFVIFMFIFVGAIAYTKAFKVKNRIVDTIENYDGNIVNSNGLNSNVKSEIDDELGKMAYRISDKHDCNNSRFNDRTNMKKIETQSDYRYCIYETETEKGKYYSVVAYVYFEIPIINVKLEFPIYGETRIFMNL